MKIVEVLTQYGARVLDRPFIYLYNGERDLGPRYRIKINFDSHIVVGFVLSVSETELNKEELEEKNGYAMKMILDEDIIDDVPLLDDELMSLAEQVADYYCAPLITVLQAMLPLSLSPKMSSLKGPKIAYEKWVEALSNNEEGLTARQKEMLRLIVQNGPILKKEAGSATILDNLIKAGRVRLFLKEKMRINIPEEEKERQHDLTYSQQKALDVLESSSKDVDLLEGVTGSGKTEVYLHLSEKYLNEGKSVLMLVPEINLTPVMVEYFSRRFGSKVAILHSGLTNGERYDEYRRIARGNAQIVVGARSAVFAPLKNIGLIILDEEHVESYKQDNSPYYHAREVAIMRGKSHGAKVVLGSATPTLETKARAMRGVYGYAEMKVRVNSKPLPKTSIVDLNERANFFPPSSKFYSNKLSKPLIEAIADRLNKNEQSLLLINRRGFWTSINCSKCHYTFTCPNCGGNLTYHKSDEMIKCHHCGYVQEWDGICPNCHSHSLRRVGYGTERVVEELHTLFPSARIARIDGDVGQISKNVEKIIKDFRAHEYDILIGTQMIAKGHDFPLVTLSAVVAADIGLSLNTYRAAERTFELIAQAVGRSGRSDKAGEAIIQTYNPTHYAVIYGAKQDYEAFFIKEMQERKVSAYPPYYYLMVVEFSSKNEERCLLAASDFKKEFESMDLPSLIVVGPLTPYYAVMNDKHRRFLLLKTKNREQLNEYLKKILKNYSSRGGVDVSINVDPLDY